MSGHTRKMVVKHARTQPASETSSSLHRLSASLRTILQRRTSTLIIHQAFHKTAPMTVNNIPTLIRTSHRSRSPEILFICRGIKRDEPAYGVFPVDLTDTVFRFCRRENGQRYFLRCTENCRCATGVTETSACIDIKQMARDVAS